MQPSKEHDTPGIAMLLYGRGAACLIAAVGGLFSNVYLIAATVEGPTTPQWLTFLEALISGLVFCGLASTLDRVARIEHLIRSRAEK